VGERQRGSMRSRTKQPDRASPDKAGAPDNGPAVDASRHRADGAHVDSWWMADGSGLELHRDDRTRRKQHLHVCSHPAVGAMAM